MNKKFNKIKLDAWMEANNFDPKTAKKDFKSQAGVWFCLFLFLN